MPSFLQAKITPSPCAHAPPPPPEALWVPSICKRPPSALPPSHRILQFFSSLPNVRPPVAFLPPHRKFSFLLTLGWSTSQNPLQISGSVHYLLLGLFPLTWSASHLHVSRLQGPCGSMPGALARELAVWHFPPGRVVLPLHPCSRPCRAWSDMPLQTQTPLDKLCQMPHSSSPLTGGREGMLRARRCFGQIHCPDRPKCQRASQHSCFWLWGILSSPIVFQVLQASTHVPGRLFPQVG